MEHSKIIVGNTKATKKTASVKLIIVKYKLYLFFQYLSAANQNTKPLLISKTAVYV